MIDVFTLFIPEYFKDRTKPKIICRLDIENILSENEMDPQKGYFTIFSVNRILTHL